MHNYIILAPVIGGLMAGISPVTRAMMSKRVQEDEQGERLHTQL